MPGSFVEVIDCLVDLVLRYEGPYKIPSDEGGVALAGQLSMHLLLLKPHTCPWCLSHTVSEGPFKSTSDEGGVALAVLLSLRLLLVEPQTRPFCLSQGNLRLCFQLGERLGKACWCCFWLGSCSCHICSLCPLALSVQKQERESDCAGPSGMETDALAPSKGKETGGSALQPLASSNGNLSVAAIAAAAVAAAKVRYVLRIFEILIASTY